MARVRATQARVSGLALVRWGGCRCGTPGRGAGAGAAAGDARFTQEDVNRMLAEDRRKHQTQVQRVEKTLEEMAERPRI